MYQMSSMAVCLFLWGKISPWNLRCVFLGEAGNQLAPSTHCPCSPGAWVTGTCRVGFRVSTQSAWLCSKCSESLIHLSSHLIWFFLEVESVVARIVWFCFLPYDSHLQILVPKSLSSHLEPTFFRTMTSVFLTGTRKWASQARQAACSKLTKSWACLCEACFIPLVGGIRQLRSTFSPPSVLCTG